MPVRNAALTRLVQERVGDGRSLTIRAFAERAIDPETGTSISKSTAGNLVQGHRIKITPEVLGAIAAGLGVDLPVVQAAAMAQYVIGAATDPFNTTPGDDDVVVRVARDLGAEPGAEDMSTIRAFADNPSTSE